MQYKGTELDGFLKVNLASKMTAKLSFQSNLEFTEVAIQIYRECVYLDDSISTCYIRAK